MTNFLCKDVVENIMGYIDAELDYKTLKELERHLDDCPECKAFTRTYKSMLKITSNLRKRTFVTPEIRERLKKCLKSNYNFK